MANKKKTARGGNTLANTVQLDKNGRLQGFILKTTNTRNENGDDVLTHVKCIFDGVTVPRCAEFATRELIINAKGELRELKASELEKLTAENPYVVAVGKIKKQVALTNDQKLAVGNYLQALDMDNNLTDQEREMIKTIAKRNFPNVVDHIKQHYPDRIK